MTRCVYKILGAVLFFSFTGPCFGLALSEIPALIKGSNEEVQAALKDREAAEHGVWSARARHLPSLSLKGSYIHLGSDIQLRVPSQTFPVGGFNVTVDLPPVTLQKQDFFLGNAVATWPLFVGGRFSAGVDAAKAQVQEAEASHSKVTEEKIQEAVQRYFSVQMAREILSILSRLKEDLDRIRGISESLVRTGLGAKFSILQIKVAQADLQARIAEASGKAQLADLAFKTSTGRDSVSTIAYDTPLVKAAMPAKVDTFKVQALQKRKEFSILKAKSEQVDALKAVHVGEMLPSVVAVGSRNLISQNLPLLQPHWAVGVMVEVPLTSFTTSLPERARAVKLAEKVEILTTRAKQEIPLQIEKIYAELTAADAAYQALQESIALAKEALRLAEVRFKNGDGSGIEILRAATDYEQVQIKHVRAIEEFDRKLIELHAAAGEISQFFPAYETAMKK